MSYRVEYRMISDGPWVGLGPPFVAETRVIESDSTEKVVAEYQDAPVEATA